MPFLRLLSNAALLATLLPAAVAGQQSGTPDDTPNASITHIRGDLYRAQARPHRFPRDVGGNSAGGSVEHTRGALAS
jgi:hypothetical protein